VIVKKFYADTAGEALRLVRKALGAEALILGNRRTAGGVEIMAVAPSDFESVTGGVAPARTSANTHAAAVAMTPHVSAMPESPVTPLLPVAPPHPSSVGPGASDTVRDPPGEKGNELVQEMRSLRSMVEGQLAAFAWNDLKRRDLTKVEVLRCLMTVGIGATLSRELVDELPDGLDVTRALRLVKTRLQNLLPVASPTQGLVDEGGIYALVGPTGVGKTTTVAKLAAECALRLGRDNLALVTTDTYRIGAVDQLRIYGKILNVPVFAIRDEADLQRTLDDLRMRHLVLIDTVGMSQRDRRLADQVALLTGGARQARRILLLAATAQANVLEDVARAYAGEGLAGCILTKVDEALTLGGALDVLVRHRLTLHFVANGQRVPEDLHPPNPLYLVERVFRAVEGAPAGDDDFPITLAAAGRN
jgi:flagellar biosynthesis protein FlhF